MITPSYALTATERVLPRLALNFTTATADVRVATARAANTATRFNPSGQIEIVNANLPRFDFSPASLVCLGQLIEEARTNLLLNSLIDGTNLSTQSVTLSAVPYTLSFYGSGSVAISGGHSATVAGAGNFPSRKTYTFTPTAGSSTFTVTGDVKFAQLEAGAFATSFIPTAGAAVLRNADIVTMTGTNFSDWFNATTGAFGVNYQTYAPAGSNINVLWIESSVSGAKGGIYSDAGTWRYRTTLANMNMTAGVTQNAVNNQVFLYGNSDYKFAGNGTAVQNNTGVGALTDIDSLQIGNSTFYGLQKQLNGWMRRISYWPQRITNAEIQAFSK